MNKLAHRRPLGRDATALTIGSVMSGLTAYGFVVIGTRAVGAEAFAPVSVLWSLWAISAAAITFPLQHWIIRTVEMTRQEDDVWAIAPKVWASTLVLGFLVFLATSWEARRLFGTDGVAFPVMAGSLPVGSVLMGFNRGMLAARSQFGATAVSIAGENMLRLGLAAGFATVLSAESLGWTLIAGFAVAALYPTTLVQRGRRSTGSPPPMDLLGGVAGANAVAQLVLTSGPILVSVLGGGGAAVTALFAMLAVLRAPHTLLLGVTTRIMAPLTRLAAGGPGRLRTVERRLFLATLSVAVLGALLGPTFVPFATRLVFGVGSEIPVIAVALLTTGTAVATGVVAETLLLLAEGRGRRLRLAWAAGLAAGGLVLLLPLDPVVKVAAAFALAEIVALVVMVRRRRLAGIPLPGRERWPK